MPQIAAIHSNDAFLASGAVMADAAGVVGVAVAVLVVAPVPPLLGDAVKGLDDADGVTGLARDVDRVTVHVTVVIVQHRRTCCALREVKREDGGRERRKGKRE